MLCQPAEGCISLAEIFVRIFFQFDELFRAFLRDAERPLADALSSFRFSSSAYLIADIETKLFIDIPILSAVSLTIT